MFDSGHIVSIAWGKNDNGDVDEHNQLHFYTAEFPCFWIEDIYIGQHVYIYEWV